ncbi:MAG: hypothetical protein ABI432_07345 [Flavobacteriales bacterium]
MNAFITFQKWHRLKEDMKGAPGNPEAQAERFGASLGYGVFMAFFHFITAFATMAVVAALVKWAIGIVV